MQYNLMIDYLKYMTQLIHSSFFVYENHSLVCKSTSSFYDTESLIQKHHAFKSLLDKPQLMNYYVEDDFFALGTVKNLNTPYTVIIGPFRIREDTEKASMSIYNKYPDFFESLSRTKEVLLNIPLLSLSQLFNLLGTIFIALNQQTVSLTTIGSDTKLEPLVKSMSKNVTERLLEVSAESQERTHSIEYEKRLVFAIKNGLMDRIDKLEQDSQIRKLESFSGNNFRNIKNGVLTLNTICLRAAIEGGVNEETAYNLGDVFSNMIESSTSISSLRTTSSLVKREYCKQVQNVNKKKIDDPIVLRAIKYIYSNVHNKITASDIADYLNITPQYLSARFAAAADSSIPEFILKAKISEAKQLLKFSNTSLNEIAMILSFSSQSYFQTQFKKIVGITPLEYRHQEQLI